MDALKRSLVEKTGHDFGFEYTVNELPQSITLGSARHRLQVEISFKNKHFRLLLNNAKLQLLNELRRDFAVNGREVLSDSVHNMALVFKRAAALAHSLPNQAESDFESALTAEFNKLPDNIKNTEVERIVRQRIGQDTYRRAMQEYWGDACAVTAVSMSEVLRASHALPWAECETDAQRLDVFNGFLLTANLDALFDRFLISFDAAGNILIADGISENDREFLGLQSHLSLRWITEQHESYLGQHRLRLKAHQTKNS